MNKVFRVKTQNEIVANPGNGSIHVGVTINWFCTFRNQHLVFLNEAVNGVSCENTQEEASCSVFAERVMQFVDQFFTWDEAETLKNYLIKSQACDVVIESMELPISHLDMSFSEIPCDSTLDTEYGLIEIPKTHDYPFDFEIRGYFDKRFNSVYERYEYLIASRNKQSSSIQIDNFEVSVNELMSMSSKLIQLKNAIHHLKSTVDKLTNDISKIDKKKSKKERNDNL